MTTGLKWSLEEKEEKQGFILLTFITKDGNLTSVNNRKNVGIME